MICEVASHWVSPGTRDDRPHLPKNDGDQTQKVGKPVLLCPGFLLGLASVLRAATTLVWSSRIEAAAFFPASTPG